MKKLLSLAMVGVMMFSALPMAYATTDMSNGTEVEYLGDKTTLDGEGNEVYAEAYTVTVPAKMAPGDSAFVKAEGTWNSNRKLVVTADKNVVLKNSIKPTDTKTLTVAFNDINLLGDNNVAVANYGDGVEGEPVAVGAIENALFGTWSGIFEYQAEIVNNVETPLIYGALYSHVDGNCDNTSVNGYKFMEDFTYTADGVTKGTYTVNGLVIICDDGRFELTENGMSMTLYGTKNDGEAFTCQYNFNP